LRSLRSLRLKIFPEIQRAPGNPGAPWEEKAACHRTRLIHAWEKMDGKRKKIKGVVGFRNLPALKMRDLRMNIFCVLCVLCGQNSGKITTEQSPKLTVPAGAPRQIPSTKIQSPVT
jgi:hypothetical protein